jgi:uncharacterized membrane protein YheB (UPF0754 family)
MRYGLVLIPFISAFIGWFSNRMILWILFHPRKPRNILGFTLQGIFPAKQQQLTEKLGKLVSQELFAAGGIAQTMTDPANIDKLMPVVEAHIDHFLRVKLPKQMPMIGMLIGDKTIGEMKKVFMAELELLFPAIMKNYMSGLQEGKAMEGMIEQKLSGFSAVKLEQTLKTSLIKELRLSGILGAVLGFIIGILQVLLIILS